MKPLILISFLLLLTSPALCQKDRIDSLIDKIDNNNLVGVCNYVWLLKNSSREVDTLIALSQQIDSDLKPTYNKIVINKLISFLTDTKKGIIAHYTLTNIWTSFIQQGSQFLNDSLSTIRYTYNELEFYWDHERQMFADPKQLSIIKDMWESRFIK